MMQKSTFLCLVLTLERFLACTSSALVKKGTGDVEVKIFEDRGLVCVAGFGVLDKVTHEDVLVVPEEGLAVFVVKVEVLDEAPIDRGICGREYFNYRVLRS